MIVITLIDFIAKNNSTLSVAFCFGSALMWRKSQSIRTVSGSLSQSNKNQKMKNAKDHSLLKRPAPPHLIHCHLLVSGHLHRRCRAAVDTTRLTKHSHHRTPVWVRRHLLDGHLQSHIAHLWEASCRNKTAVTQEVLKQLQHPVVSWLSLNCLLGLVNVFYGPSEVVQLNVAICWGFRVLRSGYVLGCLSLSLSYKDSSAVDDEQRLVWFRKYYVPPFFLRNFNRG